MGKSKTSINKEVFMGNHRHLSIQCVLVNHRHLQINRVYMGKSKKLTNK